MQSACCQGRDCHSRILSPAGKLPISFGAQLYSHSQELRSPTALSWPGPCVCKTLCFEKEKSH